MLVDLGLVAELTEAKAGSPDIYVCIYIYMNIYEYNSGSIALVDLDLVAELEIGFTLFLFRVCG